MLNQLKDYFYSLFNSFGSTETYGKQLEQYIVSNNPTSTAHVEQLERQFQVNYNNRR